MSKMKRQILSVNQLRMEDVWDAGSSGFANWLRSNLNALSETLLMDLELSPLDSGSGDCVIACDAVSGRYATIVAASGPQSNVVPGEALQRLAESDGSVIVVLAETLSQTQTSVLNWWNHQSGEDGEGFGVEVQVLGMGESQASILFNLKTAPNGWREYGHKVVEGDVPTDGGYRSFWQGMIDTLVEKRFLSRRSAWENPMFSVTTGYPEVQYCAAFNEGDSTIHLGLHIHLSDMAEGRSAFERLQGIKTSIEGDLAGFQVQEQLDWSEFPETHSFWIGFSREGSIQDDPQSLSALSDWCVERLVKFKYVFDKYLHDAFQPSQTVGGEQAVSLHSQ